LFLGLRVGGLRTMMPTRSLLVAPLFVALACGGGSSSGGGNVTPPPPPPPTTQTVTITVVSRSVDPNADAGQLYAYVGDASITRAGMTANLNENAPTVRLVPGSSRNTATLTVARGKVVTVFAVEFATNGFRGEQPPTPILTAAPREMIEFVGWEGNPATPEPGVAVIQADADKTLTANFDRVMGLPLRLLGCVDLKVQTTNTAGLLSFGRIIADTAPDLTGTNGFGGVLGGRLQPEYDYAYIWGKQGSVVTLRTRVREDRPQLKSGFIRWDGSAAPCGTNLTCQLPIPVRGNAPGPMRMTNGYSLTGGTVYGCGCTPNTPCQMLP
jgi:hypothetical protein